uniref:Lipoprotein n=1 Tax=Candidatus Kentrum eta TaxID=2126337 RepID=A0A450VBQ8_9GAMM|nr:MAG: hypothetical protein BECKH772A_GA0070896_1008514 [Candidatus Kentron sp. H]VFJ96208.1 MAG: hypothetical protein BECKH772B_GA0070898_1008814 [Candidatus Kentron sp. H]VFK02208.1 MAG: hypothetical protein BECKH772C_GA0070978_1008414 [Candidatus Kentron sp. H]
MNKKTVILLAGSIFLSSCATGSHLDKKYREAVADAAQALKTELSNELFAVNEENRKVVRSEDGSKVLVLTWKSQDSFDKYLKPYDKTSENEQHVVWVTLAPQVYELCHGYIEENPGATKEALDLRLKQYLGLKHTWYYDVFVEMGVSPNDLFRPCVNPEIHDSRCGLHFQDDMPQVKGIENYGRFYRDLYYKSFRSSDGVPWTGLGHTHDWGNPLSEVGASEYILSPGSGYEIKGVTGTMEYCKQSSLRKDVFDPTTISP